MFLFYHVYRAYFVLCRRLGDMCFCPPLLAANVSDPSNPVGNFRQPPSFVYMFNAN